MIRGPAAKSSAPFLSTLFLGRALSPANRKRRHGLIRVVEGRLLGRRPPVVCRCLVRGRAARFFADCLAGRRSSVVSVVPSRALQVQLYGIAPRPLSLYPYIQLRCFVQQRRTAFKIKIIPDAITPRCVGHNFTERQWLEATSYGHTSTRMRVAEASGKVAARGSKREIEFFCPDGFSAAIIKYCTHGKQEDGEFIRWAAAGETPTPTTRAVEALQALRATVQLALKDARPLAFPAGFEVHSQEPDPGNVSLQKTQPRTRSSGRSRSPR